MFGRTVTTNQKHAGITRIRLEAFAHAAFFALALVGCEADPGGSSPPLCAPSGLVDSTPRIALISALGQEAKPLVDSLDMKKDTIINGSSFSMGKLEGKDVVVAASGVSVTNAAMTTQILIDRFNITGIVYSGFAGGVDPNLYTGDVVIPELWAYHDESYWARSLAAPDVAKLPQPCGTAGDLTCLGLELSPLNQTDGSAYGVNFSSMTGTLGGIWSRKTQVISANSPIGGEFIFDFPVDPDLYAKATTLGMNPPNFENCGPNACTGEAMSCLSRTPALVVGGRGLSGSVYLDNAPYRQYLYDTYQGRSLDMETAAAAHVARTNMKPFIALRSLAGLAGSDDGDVQTLFCTGIAEKNALLVVQSFLQL